MKTVFIRYYYSGYCSTSRSEHAASVALMEECIEYDLNSGVKVEDDRDDFSGILEISTELEAEEILEALNGYCEVGYDNKLGGYYEFEID